MATRCSSNDSNRRGSRRGSRQGPPQGQRGNPNSRGSDRDRRTARPYVLVNMAMTADGKIATADRALSRFGSAVDRRHLFALRATVDAVMAGARTVELERATLGPGGAANRRTRRAAGLEEHPLRVVASGRGTLDPKAALFRVPGSPVVVLVTERAARARRKALESVADDVKVCGRREIDWTRALRWLRRSRGVGRLLVEGGGELNGALIRAGLVDELHLTVCPLIVGGRGAPSIADGPGVKRLAMAAGFELVSMRRAGDEVFLTYRRAGISALAFSTRAS